MRWVGWASVAAVFAWSAAGPASAQHGPLPLPPADAPVVASLPSATLVAFDHGADLCFGLRGEGPATCGSLPVGILDPDVESESVEGAQMVYGATSADAVSVEVLANGARVTGQVSQGAYAGQFAGRARFFLVAISGRPYRVLLRDAQGRVVAATDVSSAPAIGRAVDVRHGHIASRAWRAAAYQVTRLTPTPLDRGHTERLTCIRVVVGRERPLGEGCSGPETDPSAVSTTAREHCNPSGLLLTGVAGPNVRGIDAVLGDGTLRGVPLDPLPASFGDPRRAYALGLESGTAVRSLRIHLLQRVQTLPLEQAPGGATCRPGLSNQAEFLVGGFATEPQASPLGALVARDDGDRLCVGLGAIVPEDCQIPPIDPLLPRVDIRRAVGQTALLAVVAPEVASLRLELDRGAPVTVATTDLPGYTGRYVGLVRAVASPLPAGAHVYATDELAADGHVLQHSSGPDLRPLAHAPAVLARLPGGVVVAASSSSCIQVGVKVPTRDALECHGGVETTFAFAPCAARRLVILARGRHLRVTTDRGVIRGRRIGGFAVAIVPRDAAVRAPVRLPPAAEQCGYALQI